MAISIFWDSNFSVRALTPSLISENDIASPVVINAAASKRITVIPNTKSFVILRNATFAGPLKVEVCKTEVGGAPVPEAGSLTLTSLVDDFVIPAEGVKDFLITNTSAGAITISFMLLGVASGEGKYWNSNEISAPFAPIID